MPWPRLFGRRKACRKRPAGRDDGDDSYGDTGGIALPAGILSVKLKSVKVFEPHTCDRELRKNLERASFDQEGTQIFAQWIDATMAKMKEPHRNLLLQKLGEASHTVGTMCSGTESPVLVYRAVRIAAERRSINFHVDHQFACDKDATVHKFIQRVFRGEVNKLFRDTGEMSTQEKVAPDILQNALLPCRQYRRWSQVSPARS